MHTAKIGAWIGLNTSVTIHSACQIFFSFLLILYCKSKFLFSSWNSCWIKENFFVYSMLNFLSSLLSFILRQIYDLSLRKILCIRRNFSSQNQWMIPLTQFYGEKISMILTHGYMYGITYCFFFGVINANEHLFRLLLFLPHARIFSPLIWKRKFKLFSCFPFRFQNHV